MQQHLRYDEVNYCYDTHATLANRGGHASWEDACASQEDDHDAYPLREGVRAYPLEEDYYYDTHPLLEDQFMSEGSPHYDLLHYLMEVLRWLYHEQVCVLHGNLGIYPSRDSQQSALVPDLSVFQGMVHRPLTSWKLGQTGPAPQVVFEVASGGTWDKDVEDKPRLYARMGVKEYFLYDPADPPVMKDMPRLLGWKLYPSGLVSLLSCEHPDDWLWSEQLESYLGADEEWLRLYDDEGQRRLTEAEARKQHEQELRREMRLVKQHAQAVEQDLQLVEEENQALVQEMLLVEQDLQLVEQENHTLAQEKQRAEQRARASEQEKHLAEQRAQASEQEKRLAEQRAHALAEKLRALGINPDEV